jgi:hypothetical protein
MKRSLLFWLLPVVLSNFGTLSRAASTSDVAVTFEGTLPLSGRLHFTIYEKGSNEVGSFERTFVFDGTADKGAVLSSTISAYTATARFPSGGYWRTSKTPVTGFICIYLKSGGRPFVDIELLEYNDGMPTPMSINGVHAARFMKQPH